MKISVPMRARKSNSRLTPMHIGLSFRRVKPPIRSVGQKRYVVSLVLFGINIVALIIGSVGSLAQEAVARDNFRYSGYGRSNNDSRRQDVRNNGSSTTRNNNTSSNARNTNTTNAPTVQRQVTQPTTPSQQVAESTAVPVASEIPAPAAPAATPVAVKEKPVEQVPVDTAQEVQKTVAAQAASDSKSTNPVTYTSLQISEETRNRLLALAVSAGSSGAMIYVMSLFGAGRVMTRRAIPVQYVASARGATLS